MPAKRNSRINVSNKNADFDLKHRITGAGFLLFFGALILPWLLGSHGQTQKETPNKKISAVTNSINNEIKNAHLLNQDDSLENLNEQNIDQNKVYISKITPLNKNNSNVSTPTNSVSESIDIQSENSNETNDTENSNQVELDDLKTSQSKTLDNANEGNTKEGETVATVDVGWIVQVGVFTDKNGADRVVEDLQSKGFKPSTSIVDTNRGKATGTRIWLGPYAQRIDAAKAKSELTNKTGEAGFIRAYP